jgi:hypothetical protein
MSTFPLPGLTACSPSDADNKFYRIIDATENCCTSGIGRITITPRNIDKHQEYASISVSFDTSSDRDYDSSSIRTAKTIPDETASQTLCPSDALCLLSTSETITTSPTPDPVAVTANTDAFDGQVPPTSSGFSVAAKAGIAVGIAVAILLIIGLGVAAFIFHRQSKHAKTRNDEDGAGETSKVDAFATDRMIPEMDAKHSERPAELEGVAISELLGDAVSWAASRSRETIEATRGEFREMEA